MELIYVNEYYGNNFVSKKLAYYVEPGHIEIVPTVESEENIENENK